MDKTLTMAAVGTSSIMRVMQEAIRLVDGVSAKVIYSRDGARGREFARSVGVEESCSDYEAVLGREDLDLVYIASPNRFHVEQAVRAMERGKHVIVEKPAAITEGEVRTLYETAGKNRVFFFEAVTTLYMPNFLACKRLLPQIGGLRRARLAYGQYSSKMEAYLRGENPNIFNPEMQGGALNDMGIYCIHAAVNLFGAPRSARYAAVRGANGIDLSGDLTLEYPGFTCEIVTAKDHDVGSGCRIEGEHGFFEETGPLNDFARCRAGLNGRDVAVNGQGGENRMIYELTRFRDAILQQDTDFFEAAAKQSLSAAAVLEQAHAAETDIAPSAMQQ